LCAALYVSTGGHSGQLPNWMARDLEDCDLKHADQFDMRG
jgi:hypothetical protein